MSVTIADAAGIRNCKGRTMSERLSRTLTRWKHIIIEVGFFILFLVMFGEYLIRKLWSVLGPLLR
jgi:hypothetical protein